MRIKGGAQRNRLPPHYQDLSHDSIVLHDHRNLAEFTGYQDSVWSFSFSPDGNSLATASSDGTARLWTVLNLEGLLQTGCDQMDSQWSSYPQKPIELAVFHTPLRLSTAGINLAKRGDVEEAVSAFERALELDSLVDLDPGTEEVDNNPRELAEALAPHEPIDEGS